MELSILTVRSIIYLFHCLCTFKSYIPVFAMATSPHSLTPDAQLLPHIFTTSPIAFAVEDLDGTPLYVNPAFCSFLGFSGEELRHKHCVDFSPPEDAEKDWFFFSSCEQVL
jgi:PAS domain-containing protein